MFLQISTPFNMMLNMLLVMRNFAKWHPIVLKKHCTRGKYPIPFQLTKQMFMARTKYPLSEYGVCNDDSIQNWWTLSDTWLQK